MNSSTCYRLLLIGCFCVSGGLSNAQELSLSTDFVFRNPKESRDNEKDVTRNCDVTAAVLAKGPHFMELIVLDRIGYGDGIGRRLRRIYYDEISHGSRVMPLPPSKPQLGGDSLSSPGDGMLVLSPDALYCGVYYEQQDDPILDHYQFMLTRYGANWMEKRIWTPLKTERRPFHSRLQRESWVARWMAENRLMVNYAKTSESGDAVLVFDQYDYDRALDGWKRTTKSHAISQHLDVMADYYSGSDNALALIGYHEPAAERSEWPPYNKPAKRILWTIDLEKDSVSEVDLGEGYVPKSLFQIDGMYGFSTEFVEHIPLHEVLLKIKTEGFTTHLSVVMLHQGKTLKRDFKSSSDVSVHAIPDMGLILCCFHSNRGISIAKHEGDTEPREIDFEEGYEKTLRWHDSANWLFLDAKTLDIVDNWIIDKNIYPFTYSEEYRKLIAKSTKYKMLNPPDQDISSYEKSVLAQKVLLLSLHKSERN